MATELFEALIGWHAEETQGAVFRSLMAVEVLSLTVEGVPPEILDAIRNPLLGLYEVSRDHERTWGFEDD